LAVATPGAGKTTFALRLAAELLARKIVNRVTVVAPTEHLKVQWADSAARVGIKLDPNFKNSQGKHAPGYHGVALTYAQVAAQPDRCWLDPGRPRRIPSRMCRPVLGGCGARCLRSRGAPSLPHRIPIPIGHLTDPVRHLRSRRERHLHLGGGLLVRIRSCPQGLRRPSRAVPRLCRSHEVANEGRRRDVACPR